MWIWRQQNLWLDVAIFLRVSCIWYDRRSVYTKGTFTWIITLFQLHFTTFLRVSCICYAHHRSVYTKGTFTWIFKLCMFLHWRVRTETMRLGGPWCQTLSDLNWPEPQVPRSYASGDIADKSPIIPHVSALSSLNDSECLSRECETGVYVTDVTFFSQCSVGLGWYYGRKSNSLEYHHYR